MTKRKKASLGEIVEFESEESVYEIKKRLENYLINLIEFYEDFKTVNNNRWAKRAMLIEIQDVQKQINSIFTF